MSKIINIDPSIARVVNINPVGYNEHVEIKFTANENWTGNFEYTVYNSEAKNSNVKPTGALTIAGDLMTLIIEPSTQGLYVNSHYYEIVSVGTKRVVFKGILKIVK